jgi:hypothetical protein
LHGKQKGEAEREGLHAQLQELQEREAWMQRQEREFWTRLMTLELDANHHGDEVRCILFSLHGGPVRV